LKPSVPSLRLKHFVDDRNEIVYGHAGLIDLRVDRERTLLRTGGVVRENLPLQARLATFGDSQEKLVRPNLSAWLEGTAVDLDFRD